MSGSEVRRIVYTHDTETGKQIVTDDKIPFQDLGEQAGHQGLAICHVQTSVPGKPADAISGNTAKPDNGWICSTGPCVGFLEFPAEYESPMHYTTSYDYLVVISGQIDLIFQDKTSKTVGPGDLVINVGSIHAWKNNNKEPAKLFAVALPSEDLKVNGKSLNEPPINAYKLL